ncbi:MAG: hypothetical protein ABID54_01795 [Pseudomonadota bacterium]
MIGKIVAPHRNWRRVISVDRQNEYNQLPYDTYPITHRIRPEGIGATLINGDINCSVSFHRYENGHFYIGTASKRSGRVYTEKFGDFLEAVGIVTVGTLVELEFDGYKIYVSKI